MSRTGTPNHPAPTEADPRIPFPCADTRLECRAHPEWFSHETTTTRAAEKDIAKAKRACSGCPIVTGCLKWALAHPDLTRVGVWAATTARQRTELRRGLVERLGEDWVGIVARRDQEQRQRRQDARLNPQAVRDAALAQLETELIPTRPEPYNRWREPMTPERQAHNRRLLVAALTGKAA